MKYVCELCGSIYSEEIGDPRHGIPAGTAFADLPAHYECPGCGSEKEAFCKMQKRQRPIALKQNDEALWHALMYPAEACVSSR